MGALNGQRRPSEQPKKSNRPRVGCIEVNARLQIVSVNDEACKVFGYCREELIGSDVVQVLVPSFEVRELRQLFQAMLRDDSTKGPIPNANWNLTRTGRERYLYWANERIRSKNGGLRFYVRIPPGELPSQRRRKGVAVGQEEFRILRALSKTPRKTRNVLTRFFDLANDPKNWRRTLVSISYLFEQLDDDHLVRFFADGANELRIANTRRQG